MADDDTQDPPVEEKPTAKAKKGSKASTESDVDGPFDENGVERFGVKVG